MRKRLAYSDAPQVLRDLIAELQQGGDYLVIEDQHRQAVACLAPLPVAEAVDRDKAAHRLRKLLDSFPNSSPYSEEETFQHIDEALAALRQPVVN